MADETTSTPKPPRHPWTVSMIIGLQTQYGQTIDDGAFLDVIDAWDEYTIEGNPEGFDKAVAEARAQDHYGAVRVFDVVIDHEAVEAALVPQAFTVRADVKVAPDA